MDAAKQNAREWATQRLTAIKASMWDLQKEANGLQTFLDVDDAEKQRQEFISKQEAAAAAAANPSSAPATATAPTTPAAPTPNGAEDKPGNPPAPAGTTAGNAAANPA